MGLEKPHVPSPTNAHDPLDSDNDDAYARSKRKGKALENKKEDNCNTKMTNKGRN
jgi:hypothetical protein